LKLDEAMVFLKKLKA